MQGVAIELRTQCGGCGQSLPLNACAERVTCGSCHRVTELDAERWRSLLEDPLDESARLAPDEGGTATIMTGGASYQLTYGNQAPRCRACKTEVPDAAAGLASRGWASCVGCGQRLSIRPAPPALAGLGVLLVIGEDPGQLGGGAAGASAPRASGPVVLYCPHCKGPLSVDGRARLVQCQYCSTDVYLPDELWTRLHPVATVERWYLGLGTAADAATRALTRFKWYGIADAVIDPGRNVYCVGSDDDSNGVVWCLGPDGRPRWVRTDLEVDDSDSRLALDPRGRLLVWQSGKHSLVRLAVADGRPLDRLGGRQPEGAEAHHLDLDDGKWVGVDVDGTILALLGERLVRFGDDGSPLPTWPPRDGLFGKKAEKLRPIYGPGHQRIDVEGVYVENVGHHPTELDDYSKLHVGWDGRLFVERSEWIACFDRAGKRLWRIKLPADGVRGDRLGTDGAGNLYVLAELPGDPRPRVLLRISPDGERVDTLAHDRRIGGVIGDEELLLVSPDGVIIMLRHGMRIRVLGPDGRLLHLSEASRESDAEDDAERARRA